MFLKLKVNILDTFKEAFKSELINLTTIENVSPNIEINTEENSITYATKSRKGIYTFKFGQHGFLICIFNGRRISLIEGSQHIRFIVQKYIPVKDLIGNNVLVRLNTISEYTIILKGEITAVDSSAIELPLKTEFSNEEINKN